MGAEFWAGMFNLNHDFRTFAPVLENVWGKVARFPGSRSFGDGVATGANGLIDEAHVY